MTVATDEIEMIESSHTDKWLLLEAGGGCPITAHSGRENSNWLLRKSRLSQTRCSPSEHSRA